MKSKTFIKHTFQTWKVELQMGRIDPMEALYRWTVVAVKEPTVNLKPYAELIREWLPKVTWLKPGDHVIYNHCDRIEWTCAADFYAWSDNYLGHVFTIGEFLRDYIAEHEPAKREEMLTEKVQGIRKARREASEQAVQKAITENPSATQQQIAEIAGLSQPYVRELMAEIIGEIKVKPDTNPLNGKGKGESNDSVHTKPKRQVTQYKISQYTKPETAAKRIIEVFGNQFAGDLALQIMGAIKE